MNFLFFSLTVSGDVSVNGTLTVNDAASTIRVSGNWSDTNGVFTPSTGTVELNGAAAQTVSSKTANNFFNLAVNNSSASQAVSLGTNGRVKGALDVNDGILRVEAGCSLSVDNSTAMGSAVASGATLDLEAGSLLKLSDNTTLDVNGAFEAVGASSSNRAVVTSTSDGCGSPTARYTFRVNNGGAIKAKYYLFKYMDGAGIRRHRRLVLLPGWGRGGRAYLLLFARRG